MYQINALYPLNLHDVICQLYLNNNNKNLNGQTVLWLPISVNLCTSSPSPGRWQWEPSLSRFSLTQKAFPVSQLSRSSHTHTQEQSSQKVLLAFLLYVLVKANFMSFTYFTEKPPPFLAITSFPSCYKFSP